MARRSPGALRAARATQPDPHHRPIDGVSRRTDEAIARLPLAVADALSRYRAAVRAPGRWLRLSPDDSTCPQCSVIDQRDTIEEAMRMLPPPARRELSRVVAPLDAEFRRRTLPDPARATLTDWHAAAWWRRRVHDYY
ncbi:hypothetical protein [Actinoplanes sp. NPDC049802]|uniref:hypothetical protein n=1 Tax=Actinoplanes sp. NPDC049802 TaxID=3154742 RepID=UPI0033D9256D